MSSGAVLKAASFSTLLAAVSVAAGARWASSARAVCRSAADTGADASSPNDGEAPFELAGAEDSPLRLPQEARCPDEARHVVRATRAAAAADLPFLRETALGSTDPLLAGNAVRALGRLGAPEDVWRIAGMLDDPRPRLRQEAVLALGTCGDPESINELVPFLDDDDPGFRALAILSIGRVGGPRALEELEALEAAMGRRDRSDAERAALRDALRRIRS